MKLFNYLACAILVTEGLIVGKVFVPNHTLGVAVGLCAALIVFKVMISNIKEDHND
jgi:hypothetical protein